jgi:hypothetical protein
MAFQYDPYATNQALQATGSSYQLPTLGAAPAAQQASTPEAKPAAESAAPPPRVNTSAGAGMPGVETEAKKDEEDGVTGSDVVNGIQGSLQALGSNDGSGQKSGMDKISGIVGTVANLYMGNYAGAAKSANSVRG